jgi:hypothetical protein
VLAWALTLMWLGVAAWVYLDARREGRAPLWNALATFLLPGLGMAVYMGTRQAARRERDESVSPEGRRLLRELTAEVERLRQELAAERALRSDSPDAS